MPRAPSWKQRSETSSTSCAGTSATTRQPTGSGTGAAGRLAPTRDLVVRERAGHRDVERVEASAERYRDERVATLLDEVREAGPLRAEHERDGLLCELEVEQR